MKSSSDNIELLKTQLEVQTNLTLLYKRISETLEQLTEAVFEYKNPSLTKMPKVFDDWYKYHEENGKFKKRKLMLRLFDVLGGEGDHICDAELYRELLLNRIEPDECMNAIVNGYEVEE